MLDDEMFVTVLVGSHIIVFINVITWRINKITKWFQGRSQNEMFMSVPDLPLSFCRALVGGEGADIQGNDFAYPEWQLCLRAAC